jgi:hypothetical protein
MIKNSKLSDFKFVTPMNPLKNAKANETVPQFLPYNMKNQQITKDSLVKGPEFSIVHGRGM